MRFPKPLAAALVLMALVLPATAQTDISKIAAAVDYRYNHLQALETNFVEIYRGPGVTRDESGVLYLKRPGKMRWDYRQPRPKLFVSDGKTAWFYVPGEQQARKMPVKKLDDLQSPIRYLLGKTRLQKEFAGLSLAPDVPPLDSGDVVLRGVPKGMEDRVNEVLLEITPDYRIRRILIEGTDGPSTEFRFSDPKENVPIADAGFRFTPPPGVETVEATQLAP